MAKEYTCFCGQPAVEWCHASCCSGESGFCAEHGDSHGAQWILDDWGCPSGYMHPVFIAVAEVLKRGWKPGEKDAEAVVSRMCEEPAMLQLMTLGVGGEEEYWKDMLKFVNLLRKGWESFLRRDSASAPGWQHRKKR